MKASSLTSRGSGDAHALDGACATQRDHHACGDAHAESYAPGDASVHGALGGELYRRERDVSCDV